MTEYDVLLLSVFVIQTGGMSGGGLFGGAPASGMSGGGLFGGANAAAVRLWLCIEHFPL